MELDKDTLRDGLKYIVGTWQPDFIVNAFSNNLEHIPAEEFKSDDGRDFSSINFIFFEDNTMKMKELSTGKEVDGTWEQTSSCRYRYTLNGFLGDIPNEILESAQTLEIINCELVFSLGFLAISMKKTEEGVVTPEPDIADLQPSAEDLKMNDIVGRYKVLKALSVVDDKFDLFTREEVEAAIDNAEAQEMLSLFGGIFEFTADHKVLTWMPLPPNVPEEEIQKALKAGVISAVKDGLFTSEAKEWKAVGGAYYYNTEEHREVFGEVKSPWDKIELDANNCIDLKMMIIQKM